jgi:hypothetical protein
MQVERRIWCADATVSYEYHLPKTGWLRNSPWTSLDMYNLQLGLVLDDVRQVSMIADSKRTLITWLVPDFACMVPRDRTHQMSRRSTTLSG